MFPKYYLILPCTIIVFTHLCICWYISRVLSQTLGPNVFPFETCHPTCRPSKNLPGSAAQPPFLGFPHPVTASSIDKIAEAVLNFAIPARENGEVRQAPRLRFGCYAMLWAHRDLGVLFLNQKMRLQNSDNSRAYPGKDCNIYIYRFLTAI